MQQDRYRRNEHIKPLQGDDRHARKKEFEIRGRFIEEGYLKLVVGVGEWIKLFISYIPTVVQWGH